MDEKRTITPTARHESDPPSVAHHTATPPGFRLFALQSFWLRVRKSKWLVFGCSASFMLIALMLGALKTPLYRVQASIEIQRPVNSGQRTKTDDAASPLRVDSYIETEIRIIESRALIERTLAKFNEADRLSLFEPPHIWRAQNSYDQNLESLRGHISAKQSDQAGIVDISFLSPAPAAGARFLNVLAQELADINVERTWRSAQHTREWTDQQLRDLQKRWEDSERVLAEYSQMSGTGNAVKAPGILEDARAVPPENSQPSQRITHRANVIAHFNVLKHEAESNRQIYLSTAARLQEASVTTAAHVGDIFVVDPAIPPLTPVTPSQIITGILGAFLGLLVAIALVALRDRFSPTFLDAAFLERYLALPVLGAIPISRAFEPANETHLENGELGLNLAFDTDVHTAEAYRSIRSALLFSRGSQRSGPLHLLFTSAALSDGKTSVVGNLGAALASANRRVLLIDGDLRNPGLHKLFGTDNNYGLADLLRHQIAATPLASRELIRETQIPDLYLLSAGQAGASAPEVLSNAQLPHLISEFAAGFDIVLIDSAPILPYADARGLARAADGVILVVKASATDRRSAWLARDAIAQDGSSIVGAILTNWDNTGSAFAYPVSY